MSPQVRVLLALTVTLSAACATRAPLPTVSSGGGWTDSLARLGMDGSLDYLALPRPGRLAQVSGTLPGDTGAPVALAKTEEGVILADLDGPGSIVRIFSPNPSGILRLYVDDAAEPVMTAQFASLFSGLMEPFKSPLAGQSGGGSYSYVPIPYLHGCRLVLQDPAPGFTYEIAYVTFGATDQPIQSFDFKLNARDKAFFRGWAREWSRADEVRFVDRAHERYQTTRRDVWPEEDVQIWVQDGPGTITEFEMTLAASDPEILHKVWVAIYWDHQPEPAVLAPVGDLFGDASTFGPSAYGGPAFGRRGDRMWCRYPMPFRTNAQIRLVNTSESKAEMSYGVTWRPGDVGHASYFNARYNAGHAQPGTPYQAARVSGSGHIVGCSFSGTSGTSVDFLDGKAFLILDEGQAGPCESAGVGHFFNAPARFDEGIFFKPSHGCTVRTEPPTPGAAAYRAFITDAARFDGSLGLLFEYGPRNAIPATYSSVVYWYQAELGPAPWPIPGFPEPIRMQAEARR